MLKMAGANVNFAGQTAIGLRAARLYLNGCSLRSRETWIPAVRSQNKRSTHEACD